jgi:DNA-binding NtrC family response regulator
MNNEGINENLAFALRQLGYSYVVAKCDYEQLSKSLSSHQIKCILLPLWGEGVVKIAQKIYQEHKVPYVLYTSHFSAETLPQVKKIPPPIYLTKIYSKDELYITIELACYYHKEVVK